MDVDIKSTSSNTFGFSYVQVNSWSFWEFVHTYVVQCYGSAGDVLEDDPVGRLKVYVYELPSKNNNKLLQKDPRCLTHMFAAEIFMHRFLLSSPVRTLNPDEADWFYTPIYPTCDLTPTGLPLPFNSPRIMRSAIQLISSNWPYWNRTEGADHFFVVPHDFGACFHYQLAPFDQPLLS
ncbi:probable beta-1,4-xylosyltransferase IRX10 [Populus alba]|uniref:probable beta-1,4-xylosyltransferase IRX10 n=1 Tax=Populus alba TaxID=43335 RepID=UPI003CC707E0